MEFAFKSLIVIIGAGGLGLMALSLLKAMGGKGAIVVDIDARKREAAEAAGALATVDGSAPDALEQLEKKAGGPIRAVIDLVGNAATTDSVRLPDQGRQARDRRPVRRRRDMGAAADRNEGRHHPGQLCRQSARPRNCWNSSAPRRSRHPGTPMPLAKANEALVDLQKGKLVGRAILTP